MYDRKQLVREVANSSFDVKNVVLEEVPPKWKNIFVSTGSCRYLESDHPEYCFEIKTRDNLIWAEKKDDRWGVTLFHPKWNMDRSTTIDGKILHMKFQSSSVEEGVDKAISFAKKNGWPLPQGLV